MSHCLFLELPAHYVGTYKHAAHVCYLDDSYFRGNRYILNKDIAVMLLFDSNGTIAGIQNGVSMHNRKLLLH